MPSSSELESIDTFARNTQAHKKPPGSYLAKLVQRTEQSALEAREFNKHILPNHQENFYLAGMNAIAEKFWRLARDPHSDPNECRMYADLLGDHFDRKIKMVKNDVAMRHLKLLEAKSKALTELARDNTLSNTQFFGKIREVFYPNGNQNGHEAKLIEDQLTP